MSELSVTADCPEGFPSWHSSSDWDKTNEGCKAVHALTSHPNRAIYTTWVTVTQWLVTVRGSLPTQALGTLPSTPSTLRQSNLDMFSRHRRKALKRCPSLEDAFISPLRIAYSTGIDSKSFDSAEDTLSLDNLPYLPDSPASIKEVGSYPKILHDMSLIIIYIWCVGLQIQFNYFVFSTELVVMKRIRLHD